MKSSLIWRFAVIVLVILGWTISLYPPQDRDFMTIFDKMASEQCAKHRRTVARATVKAEELAERIEPLGDRKDRKAERLRSRHQKLVTDAAEAEQALQQYDELMFAAYRMLLASRIEYCEHENVIHQNKIDSLRAQIQAAETPDGAFAEDARSAITRLEQSIERNAEEIALVNEILGNADALSADNKLAEGRSVLEAGLVGRETRLAGYMAVRDAARGRVGQRRIALHQFVPVPAQPQASNAMVLSYVRRKAMGKLHLGLDLRGGTEFILGFDTDQIPDGRPAEGVRDQIIEILRNRVDRMGVVEPEIKPIGPNSISLRMPSVTEGEKADIRRTIRETAKLAFRMVHPQNDEMVARFRANPNDVPAGYKYFEMEEERDGIARIEVLFLNAIPERIKGEDVNRAMAMFNEFGSFYVSLSFNTKGAAAFEQTTREHVGERLAIVLDEKVYSAPVIREAIGGGQAQISGNFSSEEAHRLAGVIESGNLPVSITIDSEFGTDPTLGRDSIHSSFWAAVWGMVFVVVFMIWYYRLAGVVAIGALGMNILLVLGTLTLTGATITLPGIAGIVLTIGMAVDANVLIFERIREELLNGKTIGNAVKSGYSRAFVTILDSNLTTLLTALILYRVGTGPIRGFAVTLSIGIVASMFTALFMTRAVFDLGLYLGKLKSLRMYMFSWIKDTHYDFLGMKKVALGVSAVLLVVGVLATVVRGRSALSIDFAGGTAVAYQFNVEDPAVQSVRQVLVRNGFTNCRVGYKSSAFNQDRLLEIVFPGHSTDEASLDLDRVAAMLNAEFAGGETAFTLVQTNSVGGLIGAQFQMRALMACLLAVIGIILYISFRFEPAYGVASVVALIHDVVIAGGIFLLLGRQLSLPVVAALLTIMGYSLNDTIVVFDRIREDLSLHTGSYTQIINLSINQTLARTVLTSVTTALVVLSLFCFGGGAINDFALVMLLGVIVGTYSSIFVASTVVASWHKTSRRHANA